MLGEPTMMPSSVAAYVL